jgi:Holliday junction resolvase RusA-like endonuclease
VATNKIILKISPRTWVRVTKNDRIFFRIPIDKLRPSGLKRRLRIEAYNEYKLSVAAEAKRVHFTLPDIGAGIIFYVPVPKSWSKKKKKLHHGSFHHSRPDLKNLLQAFEDSLLSEDKTIAYYTHLGKRWVNAEQGWIEITIKDSSRIYLEPPSIEGDNRLL